MVEGRQVRSSAATIATLPASMYQVNPMDPVDVVFASELRKLDAESQSRLYVARGAPGQYYVDGREIRLHWGNGGHDEFFVCEIDVGERANSLLSSYLAQAANVHMSLHGKRGEASSITQLPREHRLTFADAGGPASLDADVDLYDRCELMRLACQQADLRQHVASGGSVCIKPGQTVNLKKSNARRDRLQWHI